VTHEAPFTLDRPGTVGYLVTPRGDGCAPQVAELEAWAKTHGLTVQPLGTPGARTETPDDCVLVVALGGDGTILEALKSAAPHAAPVLGVNFGTVGFLADVGRDGLTGALEAVAAGEARVERRMALDADVDGQMVWAGNDVVLDRRPGHGSGRLRIEARGVHVFDVAGDGIVLASPTGSTAYTVSAGGPAMSPRVQAVVVTPLAATTGPVRSLVAAPDEPVRVEVRDGSAPLTVEIDGRAMGEAGPGSVLEVRPSATPALLLRTGVETYYDDLRTRLLQR